jgi:hypothetical protein
MPVGRDWPPATAVVLHLNASAAIVAEFNALIAHHQPPAAADPLHFHAASLPGACGKSAFDPRAFLALRLQARLRGCPGQAKPLAQQKQPCCGCRKGGR